MNKAFTIVEVVISIAIVTILMTTAVLNYYTFNDNLALSSAGQEMAISVRQAQSYGLNVRESARYSGIFNYAYGIYFNPIDSPSDYYIFIDANANGLYEPGNGCGSVSTECIERITVRHRVIITDICKDISTSVLCQSASGARGVHVTFLRPNPDAIINFTNPAGSINYANQVDARIQLQSPRGRNMSVDIYITGQVSVQ